MKKISFRVRSFDKEQFLTFNIDNEAELDEELLDYLEEEEPAGIVPVIFEEGEEFDTFSYNVTDKIRLSELSEQEINAEMVLLVLRGLVMALIDMAEYRVPVSYLVLNRHYIYIDSDYKVEFVCIPLEEMREDVDISHFLRNFLASLRFESSDNDNYVARLFTYINNHEVFNLRNMLSLVETLMEDLGIEIPDDANEIYAEYHEVEEVTSDTTVLTSEEETDISRVMDDLAAAEELDDAEDIETAMSDLAAQSEEDTGKLAAEGEVDEPEKVEEEEAEELEEAAEEEGEEPEEIEEEEAEEPEEVEEKEASEPEEVEEEEAEKPEEVEEKETDESESEEAEEAEKPEEVEEKETDEPKEAEEKTKKPEEVEGEEPEQKPAKKSVLELDEESQEMVNKLKEKLAGSKKEKQPKHTEKEIKKPTFKTKDTSSVGVVIQDDLDEFLAEKEMEEQVTHHEDSGLKIRKNIKVSRASILKNTQEELKAAEEKEAEQKALEEVTEAEDEVTEVAETEDEEVVSNSILSQTISGATGLLRGNVNVPKVNPYLIRVNTNERIMITKQNFKVGKASMGVDYTVKGNGAVSRVHAVIMNKDGIYYIRDNKSTNHTYVNGKMLEEGENELLTQDCKIVLGDEEFIFKLR
ncbi:fHA domain protein [Clostridium sp. CAG:590]|nr:fHA domain protein [Clostridium sp. CAG:590]